jgi:hypothetical protein
MAVPTGACACLLDSDLGHMHRHSSQILITADQKATVIPPDGTDARPYKASPQIPRTTAVTLR